MRNVLANTPHVTVYVPHFDDSSILLFNLDNIPPTEVSSRLDSRGICVRSGFHCSPLAHKLLATGENGAVRVSVGAFNGQREIDEACREIRKMINDK